MAAHILEERIGFMIWVDDWEEIQILVMRHLCGPEMYEVSRNEEGRKTVSVGG